MTRNLQEQNTGNVLSFGVQKMITYVIIISLMLLARDIFNVPVNKFFFVAICIAFFFLANQLEIIYMVMFTFPLLCGLPGNYIMPIAFTLYLLKAKGLNAKQFFFCGFIVFMELFACIFYDSFDFSNIVGYVTSLMFFFCLIYDRTAYDYKKCLFYFVLGTVLTSVIIVVATILKSPTWLQDIASGYFRFGKVEHMTEEALNLTLNANALAYYSIAGMSFIVVLLKCSNYNKIALLIDMFLLSITGIMTLSRTWFLVAGLMILLYILATSRSIKGSIRSIIGATVVVAIIYMVFKMFPQMLEGLNARLYRGDISGGNGRVEITKEYLDKFINNARIMFLGSGVTQYSDVIGSSNSLHNSLVQILISYGIFGSFVFIYGWLADVVKAIGKVDLLFWIPFICIFTYSLSAQIVNPHYLVYPHLLAIFAIKAGQGYERRGRIL